jgi:hypothetical protein
LIQKILGIYDLGAFFCGIHGKEAFIYADCGIGDITSDNLYTYNQQPQTHI